MAYELEIALFTTILMLIVVVAVILSSVRIINPWEQGLEIRLGAFVGKLDPGLRFVVPLLTTVIRVDLRVQEKEVPAQEVVMKNRVPVKVDAVIRLKVIDPQKAYFQINNYTVATVALAQTAIRTRFAELAAVEVARDQDAVNAGLRDLVCEQTLAWGVVVEAFAVRRFESAEGKDLWKELAHPAPLAQLRLHSGTPIEEAATCQVMAARALLEKLKWDSRDTEALREPMERAEKALESGDHALALRLALQVTELGLAAL